MTPTSRAVEEVDPRIDGGVLLRVARGAIAARLRHEPASMIEDADWLRAPGASFVTLTQAGALRGCIGSLEAWRALGDDVRSNAVSAAIRDPRFRPLAPGELEHTHIEVSVLTEPVPMPFASYEDALAQLRAGVDGVILTRGPQRGTFLPQVWEELPQPSAFIAHLLRKAGVSGWDDQVRLARYQVVAFNE